MLKVNIFAVFVLYMAYRGLVYLHTIIYGCVVSVYCALCVKAADVSESCTSLCSV